MSTVLRRMAAIAALSILAACDYSDAVQPPTVPIGHGPDIVSGIYDLQSIGGSLPGTVPTELGLELTVTGGTVSLDTAGSYFAALDYEENQSQQAGWSGGGAWTDVNGAATFRGSGPLANTSGRVGAATLSVNVRGSQLNFRKRGTLATADLRSAP